MVDNSFESLRTPLHPSFFMYTMCYVLYSSTQGSSTQGSGKEEGLEKERGGKDGGGEEGVLAGECQSKGFM